MSLESLKIKSYLANCLENKIYNTGITRLIMLCFIVLCRNCVFYKLKVFGNPALSESIDVIFPTAFSHFMSLCHVLVILKIFL